MATLKLFWKDAYLRSCQAQVLKVEGNIVFLDRTCFHPRGGGLVGDVGLIAGQPVVETFKQGEEIAHRLGETPKFSAGETVELSLDWERRYKVMRMHTATHILSSVVNREAGALITGNSVAPDESRVDFSLEAFDRAKMESYIAAANDAIARDMPVRTYFLKREEALSQPGMVKLAEATPPDVAELRVVEIGDFDRQADGGVHVSRTSEIGRIVLLRAENKGRTNRRVYFFLLTAQNLE